MVGVTEFSGLMSSFKAIKDISESIVGLRETAIIETRVFELRSAIIDAQQSVFSANQERASLVEKVGELEKKIANLENWSAEKQRYQLNKVGYGKRIIVYDLKPEMADGELPHSICANCYREGKKSVLQEEGRGTGDYLCCPRCKTSLLTQGHGPAR